ncbi:MAG: cupin domain-containing protein [Actinomycetaceae bacterium]|nr:cupin domain-containing protein [Actinomycetaceae bacterium]
MPSTAVETSCVITDLLNDLPIAKAATTSRVVVNNDVLRHVVFSFDTGQVLTEHASARAVIVQLLTGKMNFSLSGEDHVLEAGDVIYLAPGERHALEALEPCYMALTLVDVSHRQAEEISQ